MTSGLGARISLLDSARAREARVLISREREEVETLLSAPTPPAVYGFNTLLGHFDSERSTSAAQQELLRNHLVGSTWSAPGEWFGLLAAVKATQAAAGGTGMRTAVFDSLIRAASETTQPIEGSWLASYSSGDVVPGAWFAAGLNSRTGLSYTEPGDLISIINGNFISTALAIVAAVRCEESIGLARELTERIRMLPDFPQAKGVQLSVSMRDLGPLRDSEERVIYGLWQTLENRLARPSGNPLFVRGIDGKLHPQSQASFLDFTLFDALQGAASHCVRAAAYLRGAIRSWSDAQPPGANTPIQPAKLAYLYTSRVESVCREISHNFALNESEGTEDLCDRSLLAGHSLLRCATLLDEVRSLALKWIPGLAAFDNRTNHELRVHGFDVREISEEFAVAVG